jgi:hypothetical protein
MEFGDAQERHHAWLLAHRVGVDLWEAGFARPADNPIDSQLYWNLMQTQDLTRVHRVLAFAEAHLPLDRIATGPGNERGWDRSSGRMAAWSSWCRRCRGADGASSGQVIAVGAGGTLPCRGITSWRP